MSEYDDTNKGAAFKPWDDQNFILQGKVNFYGTDESVAIITAESKSGDKRLEVYQKIGVLFENKKKDEQKEGAPDYSGPLDYQLKPSRIAGWRREKDGKKYMSFAISEAEQPKDQVIEPEKKVDTPALTEDDVPF